MAEQTLAQGLQLRVDGWSSEQLLKKLKLSLSRKRKCKLDNEEAFHIHKRSKNGLVVSALYC